ncbi:hypothetical protein PILCRDRAFT_811403 [Piloderma croceum F 1598]|uniref:CID domain-containing protein n=1 Tax=Piloderma croceum (strain F 1598) TaxID=765440 RepID=A0A0C3G3N3_PILCF|nr:hypothetical protein PILCRDRAFT_811403 [Piloderma croceum F 1598]
MSLYSQNGYGHMSYGGPSYTQTSGYYQPPAAPAPFYHVDPNTFRRDYASRLAELTINSRPIIQSLSMIAQEYTRFSEIVAQCLEAHIRRVPHWMKLPGLYLLDAISKNVFEPYAREFAPYVIPLFLEAYREVDQNTRSKMEEMLLTWRTGGANGKELFGVVPQVTIERGVWGGDSGQADPTSGFYSGSGQISKSQVLSELEFTLGQKERALQANPYDNVSQNHLNVLQQLRKLVEAGVSQDELRQILNQLRSFSQSTAPPPLAPAPTSTPASTSPSYNGSLYPRPYPPPASYSNQGPPPGFPVPTDRPSYLQQPKTEQVNITSLLPSSQLASSSPSAPVHSAAPISNITNLYNALLKAGVVSASATPTGAGETAKVDESKPEPVDLAKTTSREYRRTILSQKVKLSSAGITKTRPELIHFLYDRLPVQCKQCGIRFADNSVGKKEMQDHLDMHFRQNRKASQNTGRGHSRSWFIGVDDWIHDVSVDVKGKGRTDGHRPLNAKAAAAAMIAKRDAELRALYVVVPPGDEAKPVSCPICKETIKSEFLEDDEDWVWKNATKKDDRIYHATCHAEAVASTNNLLAARLRNELASGSRGGTPEVHSSRSTPPKHGVRSSHSPSPQSKPGGTKRKVENEDASLNAEADGSPPMKKLALES